jgi:hypothetical protein
MPKTETIERTTKEELGRVQALMQASAQRLVERRAAIEAAEAARKDAVRRQALGGDDAPGLAAAVREHTNSIAEMRQALADEEEGQTALKAESKRLLDVLKREEEAAHAEKVRAAAAAVVTTADDLEASLADLLIRYRAVHDAMLNLATVSGTLGDWRNNIQHRVASAVAERFSCQPGVPLERVRGMRHPSGDLHFHNTTMGDLVGSVDVIMSWHQRLRR